MITSKLRFLIPAVVLLAFASGFMDAAKRKTLTRKEKFEKVIEGIAKKKALKPAQKETQIRQQIGLFDSGPKALTAQEMADILTDKKALLKADAVVDKIVKELTPAPKVPPLSATVTAKIKDIQDKFELVVTTELDKFPGSKKGKDKRRYVKNHLKQVNDALNAVAWNDFRLFGKDGKPYVGTMKKNDGTILLSTDIPDELAFTGDLDGLDTTAVKDAAVKAVKDAEADKKVKKAKSGIDKAKAAAAELALLKTEIENEIIKLAAEIKAGQDLIAKVDPKATTLLGAATQAKTMAYTDTKATLEKAITDATKVDFNANKDALNVPGAPVAGDLAQLKADIATGKILKADVIAATKAINDVKGPFNVAYKALKPAKAPKSDLTPEMETWLVANPEINFKKGLKTVKHKIAGKTIAEVKASIKAALDDFKTTSVWTAAGGDAAQEDALIAAKLDDAGVPASLR